MAVESNDVTCKRGLSRFAATSISQIGTLLTVLLLGTNLALAVNVAVGTCKPGLPTYATISDAVAGVPPGGTVFVCPNSYFDQVFIKQPLNLVGVTNGNTTDIVIYPPSTGLTTVPNFFGETIAPIVAVSAGPVNISNITVDGTGNNVTCSSFGTTWLVGIFYGDGSSGTVNETTARNLNTTGCGTGSGVWGESTGGKTFTVENSSFHNIEQSSFINEGNMLVTVKGNYMAASGWNVEWLGPGTLTANDIEGGNVGIAYSTAGTFSGNTIANATFAGIGEFFSFGSGAVFTSNKISNSQYGIWIASGQSGGDTFKGNIITETGTAMEFQCVSETVTGNTVNDATTGFDKVPAGFTGVNKFNSVVAIKTGTC